jgi:hypothetical protein
MRRVLFACLSAVVCATAAHAAEWRVQRATAPARITALETIDGNIRVMAGGLWYQVAISGDNIAFKFVEAPAKREQPDGALPDGRIATGTHDIARAWLAQPTVRYDHGILGDAVEAAALVIETRDGRRREVKLEDDAVFEDLEPRIADIEGDGHDDVVVVKSYLRRGSALAVIAERRGRYQIVAETPPLGAAHRWLDPAGIGKFSADGKTGIALVRQPHVVGMLELWTWSNGALHKSGEIPDTANHIAGTRQIDMSAVADFDGDGLSDIAIPSLDRANLRIVSFAPHPREIALVPLPAKAETNMGLIRDGTALVIVEGLADGSLAVLQQQTAQ